MDSFDVIPGQHNSDGEDDDNSNDDQPRRNPLRLHRLMRNQRESVAHFVPSRGFLPARNQRSTRQEHHRPRAGIPPPRDFCFILTRTLKQLLTTEAQICNFICNKRLSEGEFSRDDPYRDH